MFIFSVLSSYFDIPSGEKSQVVIEVKRNKYIVYYGGTKDKYLKHEVKNSFLELIPESDK